MKILPKLDHLQNPSSMIDKFDLNIGKVQRGMPNRPIFSIDFLHFLSWLSFPTMPAGLVGLEYRQLLCWHLLPHFVTIFALMWMYSSPNCLSSSKFHSAPQFVSPQMVLNKIGILLKISNFYLMLLAQNPQPIDAIFVDPPRIAIYLKNGSFRVKKNFYLWNSKYYIKIITINSLFFLL